VVPAQGWIPHFLKTSRTVTYETGCSLLPGIPPPGLSAAKLQEAMSVPHGSVRPEAFLTSYFRTSEGQRNAQNPFIHAGPENPVVRNNAAWSVVKSMEKLRFSTIFFGFCGF
jgi:hypothetical protein